MEGSIEAESGRVVEKMYNEKEWKRASRMLSLSLSLSLRKVAIYAGRARIQPHISRKGSAIRLYLPTFEE